MSRKRPMIALLVVATCVGVSCGPEFDYLDLYVVSEPAFAVDVGSDAVRLPAGATVVVTAHPRSSKRKDYDSNTDLELNSENDAVFAVNPGLHRNEFAFIGISPGQTRIEVRVDGHLEDHIDVVVTADN